MAQSILNSSLRSNDHQYINIENFENPQFKDSKWVLTSPRSLLACDNLGIQVNIFYKISLLLVIVF